MECIRSLDVGKVSQATDYFWFHFFTGLGPGGFQKKAGQFKLDILCIPGSSHGGIALIEEGNKMYSGPAYGQQNTRSLLGGSGGEISQGI